MSCEVRFYGMLAEKIGKDVEWINVSIELSSVENLQEAFIARYPVLKQMSFKIAVDGILGLNACDSETKLIALLPPFAGG